MDRDSITRTGTRAPGVKRLSRLNGGVPAHRVPRLRTRIRRYSQRGARRTEANRTTRGLAVYGKAPSDLPALKPYWGTTAVRNFRESGGNVGIIRSPVRATALPGDGGNVGIIRSPVRATALPGERETKSLVY